MLSDFSQIFPIPKYTICKYKRGENRKITPETNFIEKKFLNWFLI